MSASGVDTLFFVPADPLAPLWRAPIAFAKPSALCGMRGGLALAQVTALAIAPRGAASKTPTMAGKPSTSAPSPAAPALPGRYRLAVAARALAGVGLGYALASLAASLLALLLPKLGMHRADAVTLATMLAFLLYAGVVLWAFASASGWRVWRGLGAGVLVCAGLLWWVQTWGGAA